MRITTILLILCLVEVVGDIMLKKYAVTNALYFLVAGVVAYALIVFLLIVLFKTESVLYINGMWDGVSALIESIAVILVSKERLTHKRQYIGLAMIIMGILLLKYEKKEDTNVDVFKAMRTT